MEENYGRLCIIILRADFNPSYIAMPDSFGGRVPLPERAEAIATYLHPKHWSNEANNGPLPFQDKIAEPLDCDSFFTCEELDMVLQICKRNKQSGPDLAVLELY